MKSTARRSSTRRRLRRKATIVTQLPNMTHERYSIEEGSRLMKVNLLSSPYRKKGGGSLSIPGRRNPLSPPGIKGVWAVERRPPLSRIETRGVSSEDVNGPPSLPPLCRRGPFLLRYVMTERKRGAKDIGQREEFKAEARTGGGDRERGPDVLTSVVHLPFASSNPAYTNSP